MRLLPNRFILIVVSVVFLHVAVLWALQNGPPPPRVDNVVKAELLTRIIKIEPPKAASPPPSPLPKTPLEPVKMALPAPPSRPVPVPVAIRDPVSTPIATAGVLEPQPPVQVSPAAAPPVSATTSPPAAARVVEITQGETEYIKPPRVVYPPLSKRSGETGVVVVAVYYGATGFAKRAEVFKSSGFERLDRAAREAVMASQVTPFKRAGISENTEFLLQAPINFVLE